MWEELVDRRPPDPEGSETTASEASRERAVNKNLDDERSFSITCGSSAQGGKAYTKRIPQPERNATVLKTF